MENKKKNYFASSSKFFIGLIVSLIVRLIPLRAPNIEPIMATMMPFSKRYGALLSVSFAVFSILLYDLITNTLGVQTFFTLGAYGAVALASAWYFKTREASSWNFVRFAVMGTLFYDAVTGLTVGPLFFNQPFLQTFVGQIPFTLLHLAGNIAFAFILSPAIYKFLIRKRRKREQTSPIIILNPLNS